MAGLIPFFIVILFAAFVVWGSRPMYRVTAKTAVRSSICTAAVLGILKQSVLFVLSLAVIIVLARRRKKQA